MPSVAGLVSQKVGQGDDKIGTSASKSGHA